jgi:hypothetical protein
MENSKELQYKFLDVLIINFLEKFKKYTSNLENNEDNNEFHTMIFILSYITSNNLIDTATLDKYLNGNQIYEVFKKKRGVLSELSEKYKDKKQEGGGFFSTLLKFVAVLSIFNTVVESHVNVEPQALTNKTKIVELYKNNPELIKANQLLNEDGRCALIQALITNPPEEADRIITEFIEYFKQKGGFGWLPEIINPKIDEQENGNIFIESGFAKDNKKYTSITGFDLSTIMKYVKDTIKEMMDDVFSQPGYVDGQISMSLIGIPEHAETLLLRKHNGTTYYGTLETNIIGYIDLLKSTHPNSADFPPLYIVQPGFFTQEELASMKSDLYDNIVTETDTPIEATVDRVHPEGIGDSFLLNVVLEIPTKQNPAQTNIPALVIPYTSGKKLEELGNIMAPILQAAIEKARAEAEHNAQIAASNAIADSNRRAEDGANRRAEGQFWIEANANRDVHDFISSVWGKIMKYEDNRDDFGTLDEAQKALEDLETQIKIIEDKINEYESKGVSLDSKEYFLGEISDAKRRVDMNKRHIIMRYENIEPLQSANRFSVLADDDANDETIPKPAMSESKRYKNKEKKSRNAFNQRESKRQTKKEVNNYYENMKKASDYSLLSRKGKKLLGPENYVGNMNYVGNNINLGGKINKTRRKGNKNNSKTKRRNKSKNKRTKRRNNSKTKRRNKSRRRN